MAESDPADPSEGARLRERARRGDALADGLEPACSRAERRPASAAAAREPGPTEDTKADSRRTRSAQN